MFPIEREEKEDRHHVIEPGSAAANRNVS
jgi:hypothetical protein